ncbi:MAG: protein jag [Deinococcales bacterium]
MDKNLDSYLSDLGISDETQAKAPAAPRNLAPAAAPSSRSSRSDARPEHIVEEFLVGMLAHIAPGYNVVARERGENILAEITGGDSGRIIGREGRTLNAIEFLTNTVLVKEVGESATRVNVDVAGYRRRHEERLLETARRAAARVRKTGEAFEMEALSAADRRIIHIALREDAFVTTESVGEGLERRIIVKPR